MKKTQAKTIGEIVQEYLKKENLDTALDEHRAGALWPQIVGQGINRYTVSRWVKDGVMHVQLSSAPLRNELMLNRTRIIAHINEALGNEVIKEIVFY